MVAIRDPIGIEAVDTSWFQNLIGCGQVKTSDAGDGDDWLKYELTYLNHHHAIADLLSELKDKQK